MIEKYIFRNEHKSIICNVCKIECTYVNLPVLKTCRQCSTAIAKKLKRQEYYQKLIEKNKIRDEIK